MGVTMGDVATDLGILEQVQSLVCDTLQVVSYKWLSRNFSVSSNAAKRILQEFAEQNEGTEVEVVYAVSGWLKDDPRTYSVQLVPRAKLQETKQGLDGSPSHHVYSVQPCLPKDPAQLFNAELVQAQELFLQPPDVDNCLRDNRFSSITCSLVTRSVGGSKSVIYQQKTESISTSNSIAPPPVPVKSLSDSKPSKVEAPPHPLPPVPAVKKEPVTKTTVVKEEGVGKVLTTIAGPAKSVAENVMTGKKKAGALGGGSLANLWGKAPAKVKAASPQKSAVPEKSIPMAGDAEAGIIAMEADGGEASSEEDVADFARMRRCKAKKSSSRKRHIVFDEDEEMSENEEIDPEAVVNLASPEPSKVKTQVRAHVTETLKPVQKSHVSEAPTGMEVDEARATSIAESPENLSCGQPDVISSTPEHSGLKRDGGASEPAAEASEKAPSGPKRKKILKTRIDDRGREVTEVVWETDGVEEKPQAKPTLVPEKASTAAPEPKPPAERPSMPAKPASAPQKPATKAPGKGGAKAAVKGQGNIMSFFKKKT